MTKTAILLSGGIDSLVAAYLLKRQGHDLLGIHFLTGFEETAPRKGSQPSPVLRPDPFARASRITTALATQLGIPVEIMDCRREFKARVVDYFIRTYAKGKTPNPCLVCNPAIKFGEAYAHARGLGAKRVATGHYARTRTDSQGGFRLLCGKDPAKDQSYFLARLSQNDLSRAIFPLGDMTKDETRQLARRQGLQPIIAQESQDICFIRKGGYGDFLARQPGFESKPGPIEDVHGRVIGEHPGLHRFTIGQRKGINCPAGEPYYVIGIDIDNNCLRVGFKKDTQTAACRVEEVNWIHGAPTAPMDVRTRVRYRHTAAPSRLSAVGKDLALVRFESPQTAIAPGQGAVFYRGEEVLGGGWIGQGINE